MPSRRFTVIIESGDDAKQQLEQMLQEEKRCGYILDFEVIEENTDPEKQLEEEMELTK